MFGWLFGKKKKKQKAKHKKSVAKKVYDHVDLAADFFAMWPMDQIIFLKDLGVPKPGMAMEYARPHSSVTSMANWKRDNQPPIGAFELRRILIELIQDDADYKVRAVFQQIFRDLDEADLYLERLKEIAEEG